MVGDAIYIGLSPWAAFAVVYANGLTDLLRSEVLGDVECESRTNDKPPFIFHVLESAAASVDSSSRKLVRV